MKKEKEEVGDDNLVGILTGVIQCRCGKSHIYIADYKDALLLNKSVHVRCSVKEGGGKCNSWFYKSMSPQEYRENAEKIGVSSALIQKVLEGIPF